MPQNFYNRVPVRDALAAERTVLAAERTFLSYVRTAFAMFAGGLTGVHFLEEPIFMGTAYVLVAMSVIVFALGGWRFHKSRQVTRDALRRLKSESVRPPQTS